MTVKLDNASVDAIARRIVDLLLEASKSPEVGKFDSLIDAAEVARRFNISREWVYAHADELGAVRLGDGDKPRLRFDRARVAEALTPRPHPLTDPHPRQQLAPRGRPPGKADQLLPVKGER